MLTCRSPTEWFEAMFATQRGATLGGNNQPVYHCLVRLLVSSLHPQKRVTAGKLEHPLLSSMAGGCQSFVLQLEVGQSLSLLEKEYSLATSCPHKTPVPCLRYRKVINTSNFQFHQEGVFSSSLYHVWDSKNKQRFLQLILRTAHNITVLPNLKLLSLGCCLFGL